MGLGSWEHENYNYFADRIRILVWPWRPFLRADCTSISFRVARERDLCAGHQGRLRFGDRDLPQVVAEASSNLSLAAQAQFRLGQCYLKKNRPADATAAFEKLIHDFPNETNLVPRRASICPAVLLRAGALG